MISISLLAFSLVFAEYGIGSQGGSMVDVGESGSPYNSASSDPIFTSSENTLATCRMDGEYADAEGTPEGYIDLPICSGSCSAQVPEIPKFTINGVEKAVGDSCTAIDMCGVQKTGTVGCNAKCNIKEATVCTTTPPYIPPSCPTCSPGETPPEPPGEQPPRNPTRVTATATDDPSLGPVNLPIPDDITRENWPPTPDKKYVAIFTYPRLVREGERTTIILYTIGLNYCDIESSDGLYWDKFGEGFNSSAIYSASQPINQKTTFKVKKCYVVNHKNEELEYIPGEKDQIMATVDITPNWKER